MAVPITGSFKMFDLTTDTSIRGAISGSGEYNVDSVDSFEGLISSSAAWQYDPSYAGIIDIPLVDITSSAQFRNFPFTSSNPSPPMACNTLTVITASEFSGTSSITPDGNMINLGGYCLDFGGDPPEVEGEIYGFRIDNETVYVREYSGQGSCVSPTAPSGTLTGSFTWNGGTITPAAGNELYYKQAYLSGSCVIAVLTEWQEIASLGEYEMIKVYLAPTTDLPSYAWTIGGSLNRARAEGAGAGTQNAAVFAGGYDWGGSNNNRFVVQGDTEEYNGTSWSYITELNSRSMGAAMAGSQNAGLYWGGFETVADNPLTCTQEYDGATWSGGGNLGEGLGRVTGFGTQNAALSVGGVRASGGRLLTTDYVCEYDGSSWTKVSDFPTGLYSAGGAGTQNAGLVFGGKTSAFVEANNITREYNGSNWATGGNMNCARHSMGSSGTQNAALAFGGTWYYCSGGVLYSAVTAYTEEYNGTSWVSGCALPFGGGFTGNAGIDSGGAGEALSVGGITSISNILANTYEYCGFVN